MSGTYSEVGLKNGEFIFYYPSGQIQAQGIFANGLRSKTWKYFFENGALEREVRFPVADKFKPVNEGEFEPVSVYDSTGAALITNGTGNWHYEYEWYGIPHRYIVEGQVKKGKKEGFWTCSLSNGQVLYREFYKNNVFKEGIVTDGKTQEKLQEPVNNKFMLPYKLEVTESFVYVMGTERKHYPFLLFLPEDSELSRIKTTKESGYNDTIPEDQKVFYAVEKQAQYEGGMAALMKFIKQNQIYPRAALRMGIEGNVFVSFIVETDGSISNIRITKGINADLDKEAIRLVGIFPKWIPGMQNGRVVRSQFVIPIPFKLD